MFDATRAAITWTMQTGDGSESQYSRPSDVPGLDPSSVEIVQRTDANQQPQVTFRYSIGLGAQYGLLGALTVQINPGETPRAALEHSDSTLAYPAAGTQPRLARVEPLLRIEYDSDTISTTRDAKTACALADEIEAYVK